ncbi:MAG: diacylglycerol kinase family lipid kinase [Anaerolineales bacterium]|nr:diacylglycerol kinase family lipid kinase [Anaerolineales bacterium]
MKYLIIVNPISGRGFAEKAIPKIKEDLASLGVEFDLVQTDQPWHAADLAEQGCKDGYDVIATASGDGTANETLNGIMRAREKGFNNTAMGLIPVGTGNDFAYGMGLRGSLEENCQTLARGQRRRVDIGLVKGGDFPQGRYFGNGVGIGFDAAVGFEAVKIRWTRGILAYLIAALRTVFLYFKAPTVKIDYDDQTLTQASLMVSIMNGQRMGGGFYMAPDGDPTDGKFNLTIAASPSKARIFGLIPLFMQGAQEGQPEITMTQARHLNITALKETLPAHCDGETLCYQGTQLEIEIIPRAIDFITGME